jgi:hypothetical protein
VGKKSLRWIFRISFKETRQLHVSHTIDKTGFVEIVTVNLWYVGASFYNLIKREESNINVSGDEFSISASPKNGLNVRQILLHES